MPFAFEEQLSFHAVATALEGDYSRIKKARGAHSSWQDTWHSLRPFVSLTDPSTAWAALEHSGTSLVLQEENLFPPLLREIPSPPFGIYYRGALPDPTHPTLAIVGTRKATRSGCVLAESLAAALAKNFFIVSGLALGIDAAAHAGCLKGNGTTLAVLAGGVDTPHPRTNERLAHAILEHGGALLSEYPPGSVPSPRRFLERNRIVSGLSQGVLIIEAPEKSGALVTARFALDQNREVFVLPGPVTHPHFRGSHELLRKGARLVRSAEDIFEDMGFETISSSGALPAMLGEHEKTILAALTSASEGLSVDALTVKTGLEVRVVNQALSFLVLQNVVQETESGYTLFTP